MLLHVAHIKKLTGVQGFSVMMGASYVPAQRMNYEIRAMHHEPRER